MFEEKGTDVARIPISVQSPSHTLDKNFMMGFRAFDTRKEGHQCDALQRSSITIGLVDVKSCHTEALVKYPGPSLQQHALHCLRYLTQQHSSAQCSEHTCSTVSQLGSQDSALIVVSCDQEGLICSLPPTFLLRRLLCSSCLSATCMPLQLPCSSIF